MFLKLFGMNEATLMRGPPDGGKRSARTHLVFRGLLSNSPMAVLISVTLYNCPTRGERQSGSVCAISEFHSMPVSRA